MGLLTTYQWLTSVTQPQGSQLRLLLCMWPLSKLLGVCLRILKITEFASYWPTSEAGLESVMVTH